MRHAKSLLPTLLLVLALPAFAGSAGEGDSPDVAAVKEVLADYKNALERLDTRGTESLFAESSVVVENGKLEGSYADYLARTLTSELTHFASIEFLDYTVSVDVEGNIAWALETFRYSMVPKQAAATIRGSAVVTTVLRQAADGWRIVSMHGSSRAAEPPAP